jgi:hypothetical protein
VKQRRLQNFAGHGEAKSDAAHDRIKGEPVRGVVQNAHATDFICRSRIPLNSHQS